MELQHSTNPTPEELFNEMQAEPQAGILYNIRERISNGRRGLSVLGCTLVCASAVSLDLAQPGYAETSRAAIAATVTPRPQNVTFGMAGAVEGDNVNLTQAPDFSSLAGPNSAYPNAQLRDLVYEADVKASETAVNTSLSYSMQYQSYNPFGGGAAPEIVSTLITNANVQEAVGKDICDPKLPSSNKKNPHFNLKICEQATLRLESRGLRILMRKYPQIKLWTAENEPEDSGQPTNASEGGPQFAVRMWVVADKIAASLHANQVVAPGESWNFPSRYVTDYYRLLDSALQEYGLPAPAAEATHVLYKAAACDQTGLYQAFLNLLNTDGLLEPVEHGGVILNTEEGPELSAKFNCTNAKNLSNVEHKNTATISAAYLAAMAWAQYLAARTLVVAGNIDPAVHLDEDSYDVVSTSPKCWNGGPWDSAWFAPDTVTGGPGTPRIAYYVMTGQPVPGWMMHPRGKAQMRLDELALIPPINWTGSRVGDCKYGQHPVGN